MPDHTKNYGRLPSVLTRLHRWLGLLVGAQLLLWVMSGVFMSWFHLSLVRGETHAALILPIELTAQSFVAPGGIIAQNPGTEKIELGRFGTRAVYRTYGNDTENLYDALTGEKLSPLKEDAARIVANTDYAGEALIDHARLLTKTPSEFRGATPVWQIQYKDRLQTRLYISPHHGTILARRNKIWRIYDFFWMLHIMDYDERENFNNPLVKAFSLSAFLFVLSGLVLIVLRLKTGIFQKDIAATLKNIRKNK